MASAKFVRDCAPIEILTKGGAQVARIECVQCGSRCEWQYPTRMPPEGIKKYFNAHGWSLRNRTTCPDCMKSKKERKQMATVTPINPDPTPSFDAKAARREAHDLIAITFDISAGQYKDDYSDQRIAIETGVAVDWVKQRREDDFGPLKEPGELSVMRKELAEVEAVVAAIKVRFDKLSASKGWAA